MSIYKTLFLREIKKMKRITRLIITALIIISTVCVNTLTVNAAEVKKPRTYDMVIGVNQSGKITDNERVYYKVSVPSYTTFVIDYDEVNIVDSHWYSDLSIINEEDYNNSIIGKDVTKVFSGNAKQSGSYEWYDGKVSLYSGTYYFIIHSQCSDSEYNISLTPTVSSISNFKATSSNNIVKLNWVKDLGSDGYQIQMNVGNEYIDLTDTKSNNYTISNLEPCKIYNIRVRGYKNFNGTLYYGIWNEQSVFIKPNAPVIKNISTNKKHQIKIKWSTSKKCSGYQIQYSKNKYFNSIVLNKTLSSKNTSYTKTKLSKNKKYYVRIRAYKNINGQKVYGNWSATKSIKCK